MLKRETITREAEKCFPHFVRRNTKVKFNKVQFVYIDINYLEKLHEIEPEIFFDKENKNYKEKPHLGILLNGENRKYVIPLTSAKEKHKNWDDVTADWYRIYEIIDITKVHVKDSDIIVEIKNHDILNKIEAGEKTKYKQRILSILDLRKMFPVKDGVYREIKFALGNSLSKKDKQKMALMMKEYMFLLNVSDKVEEKATKIYDKQMKKNKILPYHCDYRKLEVLCDNYIVKKDFRETI